MANMEESLFEMNQYLKALAKATVEQIGLLKRISEQTARSGKAVSQQQSRAGKLLKNDEASTKIEKKQLDDLDKIVQTSRQSLIGQKAQNMLLSEIRKAASTQLDIDKRARARGTTLAQRLHDNAGVVDKLTNGITGFQTAQNVTFRLFDAGFRENNFELARMTAAAHITGQNEKELIRSLRFVFKGSDVTNMELSHLSDTTLKLQQVFGVTAEELTSAMSKLRDAMERYDVIGITAQAQEAGTILGGMAGQEFAEAGGRILAGLTSGEGYAKAVMMGVTEERRRFLAGDADAGVQLVLKASRFMTEKRDQWLARGETGIKLAAMHRRFGDEGMLAVRFGNQLDKRARERGTSRAGLEMQGRNLPHQISKDFIKTSDNFLDRVMSIFTQPMSELTKRLPEVFGSDLAVVIMRFVGAILGIKLALKGLKHFKNIPVLGRSLDRLKGAIQRLTIMMRKGGGAGGAGGGGSLLKMGGKTAASTTAGRGHQRPPGPHFGAGVVPNPNPRIGWKGGANLISGRNPVGGLPIPGGGLKMGGKAAGKAGAKGFLKKLPFGIGALIGAGFAIDRLTKGDPTGAAMEMGSGLLSIIPGWGTAASIAADVGIMSRDAQRAEDAMSPLGAEPLQTRAATGGGASRPTGGVYDEETTRLLQQMNHRLEEINIKQEISNIQRDALVQARYGRPTQQKPTFRPG